VGELDDPGFTFADIQDPLYPGNAEDRHDTIITIYDGLTDASSYPSANTRGRIAEVHNKNMHSFYDYDAHGNVRELTQIIPLLNDSVISIQYDYDLISGNVNEFRYEPRELDQLTQRFV
jgi:YD repeat-containing protein